MKMLFFFLVLLSMNAKSLTCPDTISISEIFVDKYVNVYYPEVDATQRLCAYNIEQISYADFVLIEPLESDDRCTYVSPVDNTKGAMITFGTLENTQEISLNEQKYMRFEVFKLFPDGTLDGWKSPINRSSLSRFIMTNLESPCDLSNQRGEARSTLFANYLNTQGWGANWIMFNHPSNDSAAIMLSCGSKKITINM